MKTNVLKKLEEALTLKKTADTAVEKSGIKINRLVESLIKDLQSIKLSDSVEDNIESYDLILKTIDKYQSNLDRTISTYEQFEDILDIFNKSEV